MIQMAAEFEIGLGSVLVKLEPVLDRQLTVLRNVMNFSGGVLDEPKDRLEDFSDRHFVKNLHSSIPKSVVMLNYAINFLNKNQFKHYSRSRIRWWMSSSLLFCIMTHFSFLPTKDMLYGVEFYSYAIFDSMWIMWICKDLLAHGGKERNSIYAWKYMLWSMIQLTICNQMCHLV